MDIFWREKNSSKVNVPTIVHVVMGCNPIIVGSTNSLLCLKITYRDAVITPNGVIFDRQAILEYIIAQKKDIAKRTKDWEKQCAEDKVKAIGNEGNISNMKGNSKELPSFWIPELNPTANASKLEKPVCFIKFRNQVFTNSYFSYLPAKRRYKFLGTGYAATNEVK
uniref:U-box domain-containing protein n=1 Tax=Heterorhabditis bacteriophora TaxID=37862 RepID=A0A1I7WLQ1_HETBA